MTRSCAGFRGTPADKNAVVYELNVNGAKNRDYWLQVSDDGRGFDVDAMLADADGHFGLTGMHERAARMGGRIVVTSSDRGTLVEVSVPCAGRLS